MTTAQKNVKVRKNNILHTNEEEDGEKTRKAMLFMQ